MSIARGGWAALWFAASLCAAATPAVAADYLAPVAVDEEGHLAGPILGLGPDREFGELSIAAELQPGQTPVALLTLGRYLQTTNAYFYRTNDCTGGRFMRVGVPSFAAFSTRFRADLFFPDSTAPARLVAGQSLDGYSGCVSGLIPRSLGAPSKFMPVKSLGFARRGLSASLAIAAPAGRPYAIDSQGKVIGPLFGNDEYAFATIRKIADASNVVLRVKPTNAIVSLGVTGSGFVTRSTTIYYRTGNCTGDAYTVANSNGIIPMAFIDGRFPDKIVYADSKVIKLSYRSYSSYLGQCEKYLEGPYDSNPLVNVPIEAQGFTPPFSITLH